ncbi:tetratricopeptide repeat protein [Pseudemcibacter sp.]|uniref:tetratricopeptide repeat protein n=1 Tax=Pseudemcibacter sp. TaxID=2943293 RepID=UPI003F69656A
MIMFHKYIKALLALILLSGSVNFSSAQEIEPDLAEQPFGEYLTGRHALFNHQYDVAADNYLEAIKQDPENIELMQFSLSVFIAAGRFEDAFFVNEKLKEMAAQNEVSNILDFFNKTKNKSYIEALIDIDELSSTGIMNLIKPFFRAWIDAAEGSTSEIDAVVNSFEEENNFNFFNFFQAGLIYEYLEDFEKAESFYAQALNERGLLNLRAVEAYGKILKKNGKTEKAISILEDYIDQAPANEQLKATLIEVRNDEQFEPFVSSLDEGFAEIFYTVSTILMQDNVKSIATNFLQYAAFFKPEFPLVHFLQAQIFESDQYYRGAQNEFDKIKTDSPLYFQSKLQRAWLYNDMDRPEGTIAALLKLEKEYPDNREVLNSIAEFYRMNERFAEAIPAYSKVIDNIEEENVRDWIIYYTRGIVFDQEKRWAEAEMDFKKALEIRPEQPMVLNYLAYSWVDRGLNYVEAKKMLIRAVELRPNDGYIVDSLGWALYKMGDYEEAVPVLERAAQLETQDWAINDHLGDAYWTVGRKNEARFQWRHALSLSPDEDKIDLIKSKIKDGYTKPEI